MTTSMEGKTVLVTGATNGIGKVTARELARMGARVVIAGRDPARTEHALAELRRASGNDDVHAMVADLSVQSEVRRLAGEFLQQNDALHVLVNNAGAVFTERTTTADGIERTFATNHLNYFLLTRLLVERLKESAPARIVNVSSRAHERSAIAFDDLQAERSYTPMRVYGQSKLANVLFTYELARRLEGTGVTANCLHPGVVRTGFGKNNSDRYGRLFAAAVRAAGLFFVSPEKGAETSVYLASSPDVDGITGRYFARCRATPSNAASHDIDAAQRLWEISERMCGIAAGQGP